ncbi:SPOR domain-containing protein [Pseudoxanthomonas dokdonensis]|uniref:Sporulation protein n=1 Tax=Pseudoxanthomonas dokdonensis TaxID=344882 RepID=A0A0R0CPP5_9GAMM|nr:SPOR domain-containing protein [Pseudoxanthomonas dokdonensis]KRG71913.1 sporulation protein [Pseudoxanthomonas dokdonensis]
MAARRGKSQAKRNSSQATPGWVWLILGLLIGAGVFFIFFNKDGNDFNPYRPQPNPQARPASASSADDEPVAPDADADEQPAASAKEDKGKEQQYDFYTLLPGKEVQMTDAEVAASAREEDARKARAALENKPDPTAAASSQPKPIDEDAASLAKPEPTSKPAATTASQPATPAAPAATVASAAPSGRYILQAGAFGASSDAEATKAKIALAGLNARVESAEINGKTVYRVRMGPYSSATDLAEAKQKLSASGLPAMAIKAQ